MCLCIAWINIIALAITTALLAPACRTAAPDIWASGPDPPAPACRNSALGLIRADGRTGLDRVRTDAAHEAIDARPFLH